LKGIIAKGISIDVVCVPYQQARSIAKPKNRAVVEVNKVISPILHTYVSDFDVAVNQSIWGCE
jgi:hypothetical protein